MFAMMVSTLVCSLLLIKLLAMIAGMLVAYRRQIWTALRHDAARQIIRPARAMPRRSAGPVRLVQAWPAPLACAA